MADNIQLSTNVGTGAVLAADDVSSVYYPIGKVAYGALDSVTLVTTSAGFPVQPQTSATWACTQSGTWNVGTVTTVTTVAAVTSITNAVAVNDNSGSLTVDAPVGTPVFVRLSDGTSAISTLPVSLASVPSHAVTNAGTFAVQAEQSGTWTVGLPTGAATAALQTSGNSSLTNLSNATSADSSSLFTRVVVIGVQDLDGGPSSLRGRSGTPGASDVGLVVRNIPSGTQTVSVSGTVTVGSHAVTNAGTFVTQENGAALTSLQLIDDVVFAEDAGHSTGDKGIPGLAVRNDSDTSLCGTTLDYTPLQVDSNGYLKVNIKAGAGSGGTASTDDAAFTAASGSGTPMMGFVTSDSVDSGDVGVVGMLANRQLKVTLYDSAGSELSVGGGTQYTEDAVATANPVGNAINLVRDDARAGSLVSADGDNVAARGTNAGELYVKHVDTIPVTQSGTWNVGTVTTVTTCSTVTNVATIGTSVTPGTGAAHLGKAEDAAHSTGDTGVMALAVRSNTAASTSGTDGDYQPLITNTTGHLWVDASGQTLTVGSHAVTNAGTFAVQVTSLPASTNTIEVVGDVAHDAAAAGNPVLLGAYASAAAPTDVSADADAVRLWALRSGALAVQPTYAGVLATTGNGASGTGVLRVTLANDSTGQVALAAGSAAIGKLTANTGVTIGAVEIAAAQTLATVTTVGTVTTCSTVTTVGTVTTCSTLTGSGVAHDGADSGNPHKVGAKASTALSGITLVANADRTDLYAGVDGVLIVRTDTGLEDVVQERTTNTDGSSTAFASGLAAPGAGIRLWVKSVTICNSSATFCTVDLRDGSAGSVLWTFPVPATGGVTHVFDPPLKLTANTALAFDPSAATSTITISVSGFKSKV